MKLATRKTSGPDGELLVVSRDLRKAAQASAVAATLLEALSRWQEVVLPLQAIYERLNADQAADAFPFQPEAMAAPLPRAPQWLDGSAFHSHGDLMEKVFGLQPVEGKLQTPLMYQGASDDFYGPHDDLPFPSEADGIDFEAEVAVVVDHVPMGTPAATALRHIKLLLLVNDASLRMLAPREMKTGFGFLQSKPSSSFGPVAVTPDELGDAWKDGRVHLPVSVEWNDEGFRRAACRAHGFRVP